MSNWFRSYGFADVQDNLLIGAFPLDDEDVGMLTWMKVERVLNLVEDDEYAPGDRAMVEDALDAAGIEEHRMSLTDYGRLPGAKVEHAVGEVIAWLDDGRRVYLHCRAGWQRSAAIAAGVVAVTEGVGIEEALELVHRRKPSAQPLPQQREDLLRWWAERDPGEGDPGERDRDERDAGEPELDEADLDEEALELLRWLAEIDPARRRKEE